MAISQSLLKRLSIVAFKAALVSILLGSLLACSSSSTHSTSSVRYNSYDSYYRGGINSHHNGHYRYARPVRRPVHRR